MAESHSRNMDSMEKLDRIREIAITVSEPKNAGEIADVANVSRNTAAKYLAQLTKDDVLIAETRGRETTYRPDPVTQYFGQLRELTSDYTKEELTQELNTIQADIERLKSAYDVDRPDELRAAVGDASDNEERARRRRDADDWEYFDHQRRLIQQALELYDGIVESQRTARA
jgi:sugar-specific transcriptional regulator TrmB